MRQVDILNGTKLVPARAFIETLPVSMQEQLLKAIDALESTGEIRQVNASKDDFGRYKVQIRNESNTLQTFFLEVRGEKAAKPPKDFFTPHLLFVAENMEHWIVSQNPWQGRPGEEFLVYPDEIDEVLDLIKKNRPSPDYVETEKNRYQIKIQRPPSKKNPKGLLVTGLAVWKNKS